MSTRRTLAIVAISSGGAVLGAGGMAVTARDGGGHPARDRTGAVAVRRSLKRSHRKRLEHRGSQNRCRLSVGMKVLSQPEQARKGFTMPRVARAVATDAGTCSVTNGSFMSHRCTHRGDRGTGHITTALHAVAGAIA